METNPRTVHLIVVGNGPVGFRLLNSLIHSREASQFQITVFGEEAFPAYDRIHLSDCFAGKTDDDLIYQPRKWYDKHGIVLKSGDPVVEIARTQQTVRTKSGETSAYDELVLATGSKPIVPPIAGVELPGVFVYRTLDDLHQIKNYAANCQSGIVIGGGLLGLEAARALSHQGVGEVHILESSPFLMARQLDVPGSELLRAKIESLGYQVHTNCRADGISETNQNLKIDFKNGEPLTTQIVVIAAGIRPRDELARHCGLDVAARGGVVVNDLMETSDPKIHACGECVVHNGTIYGLVGPGFVMADVVADQLAGGARRKRLTFAYGDLSTELKLLEIDVATLGEALSFVCQLNR